MLLVCKTMITDEIQGDVSIVHAGYQPLYKVSCSMLKFVREVNGAVA